MISPVYPWPTYLWQSMIAKTATNSYMLRLVDGEWIYSKNNGILWENIHEFYGLEVQIPVYLLEWMIEKEKLLYLE